MVPAIKFLHSHSLVYLLTSMYSSSASNLFATDMWKGNFNQNIYIYRRKITNEEIDTCKKGKEKLCYQKYNILWSQFINWFFNICNDACMLWLVFVFTKDPVIDWLEEKKIDKCSKLATFTHTIVHYYERNVIIIGKAQEIEVIQNHSPKKKFFWYKI